MASRSASPSPRNTAKLPTKASPAPVVSLVVDPVRRDVLGAAGCGDERALLAQRDDHPLRALRRPGGAAQAARVLDGPHRHAR